MRGRWLLVCAAVVVWNFLTAQAAQAAQAEQADSAQGWSNSEPADGPSVKYGERWMVPYEVEVPGSDAKIEMIPVRGGVFTMGSSADAEGTHASERPQRQIRVEPFWIGKTEITWAQYKPFMDLYGRFKTFELKGLRKVTEENRADAVTAPTELYDPDHTFEKGDDPQQPAVTMTQFAAKQYTKWLGLVYREGYRLPTEAEWEYACRAGTTTAYSFGDEPAELGEYAWFQGNADGKLQEVGQKKPNPWGLYDMHGSAAEWTLDAYSDQGYPEGKNADGQVIGADERPLSIWEAVVWPTKLFPRVVRGGSWELGAEKCRSAARMPSHDDDWKEFDPNLPLSPWWFTSDPARGVGFRLVRQVEPISAELRPKVWEADVDEIRDPVANRLSEARGVLGLVDPELPAALKNEK